MYNLSNLTTLYVSQENGHDWHQGFFPVSDNTGRGPVKSIERALEIIADMRAFGAMQPVTVRILDAVYNIHRPVVIKNNVSSVTIEPYCKTLLSGGIEVKGFKEDTFNGARCFSVDLSDKGDLEFSDFFVNGKAAAMTRYPEDGTLRPKEVENNSTVLFEGSKWFIAGDEDYEAIKSFRNINDCFISFNHFWIDEHTPIEGFDPELRKITLKYVSRFTITPKQEHAALEYVVENVAEMFKNPNEWYYDKPSKTLYYIPESPDIKAEDLVGYIPVTDKLFCICGEPDKKVKNITIRNFELAYTKGDYRSMTVAGELVHPCAADGFASDIQSVCDAHGGIEFEYAYGCAIENCNMYCFGVHCIAVKDGSAMNRITGNTIKNIGAGGISMSGGEYGSEEKFHTRGNVISDNRIMNCGNRYFSACGILIRHSYENTVAHNEICNQYYTGISCGWVWGYADSITHDNIIEKNHIYNLGQGKLSDMGGIYLLGKQSGTIVRNNLIHDIVSKHYNGNALYADEGSSYVVFENNICYNASGSLFHQNYGSMNTVRNNIFAFSGEAPVFCATPELHTGVILEKNIIVAKGTAIFRVGFPADRRGGLQVVMSNNNIVFDSERTETAAVSMPEKDYSIEEAYTVFGMDRGSVEKDPEFTDAGNFDFTLKDNSPAFDIGFVPVDMSDVGVRR